MTMKEKARATWEEMKDDPPGERFQKHYERKKEEQDKGGRMKRWALCAGLILGGIVLMFIPGPAVLLFALAAALLAEDSLRIAKALDWLEVKVRAVIAWGERTWKRAGTAARAGIVLVALVVAGAGAYGMWVITFGR